MAKRNRYFVGVHGNARTVFRYHETPTNATHGTRLRYVIGPFRTRDGAFYAASNPHGWQTVAEAQKLAAQVPETDVIFRKHSDGEILALFPGMAGTNNPQTCQAYAHNGQHCPASVGLRLKPARPKEFRALGLELRRIGYRLRVVPRFTRKHRAERLAQIGIR